MILATPFLGAALLMSVAAPTVSITDERAELRAACARTLRAIDAPSRHELGYNTFQVLPESSLGRLLAPLVRGSGALNDFDAAGVMEALDAAAASSKVPLARQFERMRQRGSALEGDENGLVVGGRPMLFRVHVGETLFSQQCTSDPQLVAMLRAPGFDLHHFSGDQRLELVDSDRSLQLFTWEQVVHPLPLDPRGIEQFIAAHWKVERFDDGALGVSASKIADAPSSIDVLFGPAPALRPMACRANGVSAGRAIGVALTWNDSGLCGAMEVADEGDRFGVTTYTISRRADVSDDDGKLVVPALRVILDKRGGERRELASFDALPAEARALVRVGN